jgi:hypothetical protein
MKKWVSCAKYVKASEEQCGYMILEWGGIGPINYLRRVIDEYRFGILFLGHDGPSLLSSDEWNRLTEGMRCIGIHAELRSGFCWSSYVEVAKIFQRPEYSLQGDAVLLKAQPPGNDFECKWLPKPSGFNKDKISKKDAAFLSTILSGDDVYFHDDFQYSFIVTKSPKILSVILKEIEQYKPNQSFWSP